MFSQSKETQKKETFANERMKIRSQNKQQLSKKKINNFDFTDRTPTKTKQKKLIEHQIILPKFQQNGKIDFDFDFDSIHF